MREAKDTKINLSDSQVVEKILGGEKALFELLIRRHNAALYKVARAFRFNHADAEDLMQETYLTAYLHLKQFEHRASYKTWLMKIMLNKCRYKMGKGNFKHEQINSELFSDNTKPMFTDHLKHDTEKQVLNHELAQVLEKSIEQIPLDYRTVFLLRKVEGLNVAETAEILDITESNVKVRLNRARKMVRQQLEKFYAITSIYDFNLVFCDEIVASVFQKIEFFE